MILLKKVNEAGEGVFSDDFKAMIEEDKDGKRLLVVANPDEQDYEEIKFRFKPRDTQFTSVQGIIPFQGEVKFSPTGL